MPTDSSDPTQKRRIRLEAGAALNVFLVLDASRSVDPSDYERARGALSELVEKVGTPKTAKTTPKTLKNTPGLPKMAPKNL